MAVAELKTKAKKPPTSVAERIPFIRNQRILDILRRLDPRAQAFRGHEKIPKNSERTVQLGSISVEEFLHNIESYKTFTDDEKKVLLKYFHASHELSQKQKTKTKNVLRSCATLASLGGVLCCAFSFIVLRSIPTEVELSDELRTQIGGERNGAIVSTYSWASIEDEVVFVPTQAPNNTSVEEFATALYALQAPTDTLTQQRRDEATPSQTDEVLPTVSRETATPTVHTSVPVQPTPTATELQTTSDEEFIVAYTNDQSSEETLPTQSPTPTPTFTEAPVSTLVPETVEIPDVLEYLFGGELYSRVVEARWNRLSRLETRPEGYVEVLGEFGSYYAPENLDPQFQFLHDPVYLGMRVLGAADAPQAQRDEFIRSRVEDNHLRFVLAGLDSRPQEGDFGFAGRNDAFVLLDINILTGQISIISVARDTYDPLVAQTFGSQDVDEHMFNVGTWVHENEDGSLRPTTPEFLRLQAEFVCGCLVDGLMEFNFSAVEEIINALHPEGIEITVTETLHDPTYPTEDYGTMDLRIEPGTYMMNGEQAVQYARLRHGTNDVSRQDRQRQVIIAVIRQLFVRMYENPAQALELLQVFMSTAVTSLETYDQRARDVDAGIRPTSREIVVSPEGDRTRTEYIFEGLVRNHGDLSPTLFLQYLEDIVMNPSTGPSLIVALLSPNNAPLVNGVMNREIFQTIQITSADTNFATGYASIRDYWNGARRRIGQLLGFPYASDE